MRESVVKKKLATNEPVLVMTLHFNDPAGYEMSSLMGFDALWVDLEHHAHSLETAQSLMRAARVGTSDIIARPAKGEFMRLGRLLEAGAQGIIYPRCENAAEARELVKWAKFPPLGERGLDSGNPDNPYCSVPVAQYTPLANANTFLFAMIEEEAVVDRAEEILAVDGIDAVFLGTGDFSSLGGYPGQMDHPKIERAMERIAQAARNTGKHWGRPAGSAADAARFIEMGARIIAHSSDLLILKQGLESVQQQFRSAGFQFNNRL